MEKVENQIRLNFTDKEVNQILRSQRNGETQYTRHYSQNEEFFLKLSKNFTVPSFPIHHDVRKPEPSARYLDAIRELFSSITPLVPKVFDGLTYYFDPADILRPAFFQLYRIGENHYMYMLKVDLTFKPSEHKVLQSGTNDSTPEYSTEKLFLDAIAIPLDSVEVVQNRISSFKIKQTISQTWIGETGRGYFVQGIWMDHDLTKFFSKLFLPSGMRTYPYYPFLCRYRTMCSTVINNAVDERKKTPPMLHRAMDFAVPEIKTIQECLRENEFTEELPEFKQLKARIPDFWTKIWGNFSIRAYLNERDMKEFIIEG